MTNVDIVPSKTLKALYEDIKKCNLCNPTKDTLKGGGVVVPIGGGPLQKIMIVAQNPGSSNLARPGMDFDKIIPFGISQKNPYNRFFYDLFETIPGIYYFTNIVKCVTENNALPDASMCNVCSRWLKKEVEFIRPDWSIVLGKANFSYFEMKPYEVKGRIIALFHPGYLNKTKIDYDKSLTFLKETLICKTSSKSDITSI